MILASFSTRVLLPYAIVSHRFHSLVLRITHFRLLLAADMSEYKVILESYFPAQKMSAPWNYLTYLGTEGLSSRHEGEGSLYEDCRSAGGRFAKLGGLYSRFRPKAKSATRRSRPRGYGPTSVTDSVAEELDELSRIEHHFNLDGHELFGQLQTVVSLAKLGPVEGVSLSLVTISESKTFRVWREWLAERAEEAKVQRPSLKNPPSWKVPIEDPSIAWVDYNRNVGLRLRVKERQWRRTAPLLVSATEDRPVSYSVEIEGRNSISIST